MNTFSSLVLNIEKCFVVLFSNPLKSDLTSLERMSVVNGQLGLARDKAESPTSKKQSPCGNTDKSVRDPVGE